MLFPNDHFHSKKSSHHTHNIDLSGEGQKIDAVSEFLWRIVSASMARLKICGLQEVEL